MKKFVATIACALVVGCASQSPLQTEANIVQGMSAAYELSISLYKAGKLTDSQAQSIVDSLNAADGALKAARSSSAAGDGVTSAAHLRAASAALAAITAQLATKGQ